MTRGTRGRWVCQDPHAQGGFVVTKNCLPKQGGEGQDGKQMRDLQWKGAGKEAPFPLQRMGGQDQDTNLSAAQVGCSSMPGREEVDWKGQLKDPSLVGGEQATEECAMEGL